MSLDSSSSSSAESYSMSSSSSGMSWEMLQHSPPQTKKTERRSEPNSKNQLCPICSKSLGSDLKVVNRHIDECLNMSALTETVVNDIPHIPMPKKAVDPSSPFALTCPYNGCGEIMEAIDFYDHVIANHIGDLQGYECPICYLQSGVHYAPKADTNLLEHLKGAHSDMKGSSVQNQVDDRFEQAILQSLQMSKKKDVYVDLTKTDLSKTTCSVTTLKKTMHKECPICFDNFSAGESVTTLNCLCVFHEPCVNDWFDKIGRMECPLHRHYDSDDE